MSPSTRKRRHHRVASALKTVCEPIERRLLLCGLHLDYLIAPPEFDWAVEQQAAERSARSVAEGGPEAVQIVWSNRGQASDGFASNFGTSAAAGRAVVDAALDHWERVITSWNRVNGTTSLQVNISITNSNGYGAAGAPSATAPADGKPTTGSFTFSRGRPDLFPNANDSNGWYFDPNPNDHTEFGTSITSAFAGRGTGVGNDFYSVAVAELTHVLGLISDKNNNGGDFNGYRLESSGLATNTGIMDNAEGGGNFGRFWVFQGPTVDHLMTSYNSGDATNASWGNVVHSAGVRATTLAFNGKQWQGSEDAGNALYSGNERTMPSWTMAHILRDAYGYSIIDPEQFDTFYANLNRTTGALTIRGGDFHNSGTATSNDVITINRDGVDLVVSVDVSNDIPGTRHLAGPGNLPAWTTRFPASAVNSIVVEAGNGNDTIRVLGVQSSTPITINAGAGNDLIDIGGGDFDSNISSNIVVNAGTGTDELVVNDITDGAGSDTANITTGTFTKPAGAGTLSWNISQLEQFSYLASGNNDTINITSAAAGIAYSISGLGGNDTLNVSGGGNFASTINGSISFSGGTGTDVVNIIDTSDSGTDTYQISGNRFEKTAGGGAGFVVATSSTESMVVNGGTGTNTWSVPQLSPFLNLTINGGSGTDNFIGFNNNFDVNLTSVLTFNGGTGTDSVTVNDGGSSGLIYNLDNNSLDKAGSGVLNYSGCEALVLNCNSGDNDIIVLSTFSSCPVTINGNSGNDQLYVNDGSSFLFNFGSNITFNGGGGTSDQVLVSDSGFGGTGNYTVINGQIVLPFNGVNVFFTGTESLLISGSQGNNTINVNQTNIDVWALGDGGDDTINIGNGNFAANITAGVLAAGGAGNDIAIIQDTANAGNNTWTTTAGSTTHNGATGSVVTSFFGTTIDALRINAGAGNSIFNVNSLGSSTTPMNLTIDAGAGDDIVNIAGSTGIISANLYGNVTIPVQNGTDALVINDLNDSGNDSYTVTGTSFTKSDWPFNVSFPFGSLDAMRLDANNFANTISVLGTLGENVTINGNDGNDFIDVVGNFLGTLITVDGGPGLDAISVNSDSSGTAGVQFATSQTLSALRVYNGGTARLNAGGNRFIRTTTLQIDATGALDLTNNDMIIDWAVSTPTSLIQTYLTNGYAGGAWNGTGGIRSSTAAAAGNTGIGYADTSEIFTSFPATFAGQSVDSTTTVLKYTYYGDGDLNGNVNLADFNRLAANFGASPRRWVHGNFDFNSNVNLADFNRLAANFGQSGLGQPDSEGDDRGGGGDNEQVLPSLESMLRGGEDVHQA